MYDLTTFSLQEMTRCSSALRRLGHQAESMEDAASRIVRYLYDQLIDSQTGEKSCALVRLFATQPYQELDTDLRAFANTMLGGEPESSTMKCLTLMATVGDKVEWNTRRRSAEHKAIPLPSPKAVEKSPMITQLVNQFGLDVSTVLRPDPSLLVDVEQKTYNVFYVPEALGSPYVPAQKDFVIPFDIQSVLGFGGMLPSGNLFAVIMFSKIHIQRETAEMFKTLSLSTKVALLPFVNGKIFT